jgi:hypothetical protein
VEYPALPSAVDCGGGVGFIPRLKARVFSLRFITVSGDESWSTQRLENQQYFAMIALAERDDVAYQGYHAECGEGELTAMIRDSSAEFLQTRCG